MAVYFDAQRQELSRVVDESLIELFRYVEHDRLGIPAARCPAALDLRRRATVVRAVARRVNEGDALRRALELVGCAGLLD